MTTTKKLRSPLKYFGGKFYLARRIIAHFPHHGAYAEHFAGGLSILLNKACYGPELANDINADLIGFWGCLHKRPGDLTGFLAEIHYSDANFGWALGRTGPAIPDSVPDAAAFMIRNRFSRGGLGKDFAWSDRLRGGQPGDVNAWETIKAELPAIVERIRGVRFTCRPAVDSIREWDKQHGWAALHYCDPPYLHSTRTHTKAYAHEMTEAQHVELLETVNRCRGCVVLSGYRSELYDRMLSGWERSEFDMPNHSGQGKAKQRRTECLWIKSTPHSFPSSYKPLARRAGPGEGV